MKLQDQFEEGWWLKLSPFLNSYAFQAITNKLAREVSQGKQITPLFNDTFRAFKECPYKDLKVVLLGLDPYPGKGVADGLAFSSKYVNYNEPPKSLDYILNAVEKDVYGGFGIGFNEEYLNPDLTRWAKQGVLLLNQALSTHVGVTGEHLELWIPFLRYVLKTLKENNTGLVYLLLGSKAKLWQAAIDRENNHIITAVHPSYCNYKGLKEWDCNSIFSKTNEILMEMNGEDAKIIW